MRTIFRSTLFALCAASLFALNGCGKDASAESAGGEPTAHKASEAKPAADKADDMKNVELNPLPLTMRVPKGSMGSMDMTMGDRKSVTVDIGEGTSLNVQPMPEGGLAALKKTFEKDTILHPFKRFAKEDANGFVVEFEADGKTGFVGVRAQDVGGAKYVCKTTGLDGVKTAELADKQLEACGRLKAK